MAPNRAVGTVPCVSLASLSLPAAKTITAAQVLAWQGAGEQLAVLVPELSTKQQQLGGGGRGQWGKRLIKEELGRHLDPTSLLVFITPLPSTHLCWERE